MKKIALSIFLCLLVFSLSLPCLAFPVAPDFSAETYAEYKKGMAEKELPDDFVPFERLRFLGKLEFHKFTYHGSDSCRYYLKTPDEVNLTLRFNAPYFSCVIWAGGIYPSAQITDLLDWEKYGMLRLDVDAVVARTGVDIDSVVHFSINNNEAIYIYTPQGELSEIELYLGDNYCEIDTDFSKWAPDSWIGRLLYGDDTRETAAEMKMRFYGFYEEPWERPLTICLSAIGGAVVAAAVTWLVTYLAMFKKAKKAPRFGGNAIGKDKTGVALFAGEAPTLPEAFTPSEGTATAGAIPEDAPPLD